MNEPPQVLTPPENASNASKRPKRPVPIAGTDYSYTIKVVMKTMRLHLIEHPNQWARVGMPMNNRQAHQIVFRARSGRPPWTPKGSWQAEVVEGERAGVWHVELRLVTDLEADPLFVQDSRFDGGSDEGDALGGFAYSPVEGVTHTTLGKDDCPPADGFIGLSSESLATADVLVSVSGEMKPLPRDSKQSVSSAPKTTRICPLCLASDHGFCTPGRCTCGCTPR